MGQGAQSRKELRTRNLQMEDDLKMAREIQLTMLPQWQERRTQLAAQYDAALTGVERVTDLTTAIADSMARHRDPRVAFVPEGPYVVPVHEEA